MVLYVVGAIIIVAVITSGPPRLVAFAFSILFGGLCLSSFVHVLSKLFLFFFFGDLFIVIL